MKYSMNKIWQWYTSRMHIMIDARMVLPEMTGIGRYLVNLAQGFRNITNDEFTLVIQSCLPHDHPLCAFDHSQMHLLTSNLHHMDPRAFWQLPSLLRNAKHDLLHYPHFDLPWTVPGTVVATIHDLKYIAQPGFFSETPKFKHLVTYILTAFTLRRSKRIIAVSDFTRGDLIKRFQISPDKIITIPHGVEERFFKKVTEKSASSKLIHHTKEHPYILFVGERRPHKNLESLINAFNIFQRMRHEQYRLIIAGKPYANYRSPQDLVEKLNLGNVVDFIDYVPEGQLPSLYRAASAFVLISKYEGFGLPILESMAAGTPVIAANRTALPEVVGDAGLLVSPDEPGEVADAMHQVIPGGVQREHFIHRGLERASEYSWNTAAKRTLAVYREALST